MVVVVSVLVEHFYKFFVVSDDYHQEVLVRFTLLYQVGQKPSQALDIVFVKVVGRLIQSENLGYIVLLRN